MPPTVLHRVTFSSKPSGFLAPDERTLVVHIVNAQDKDAAIALKRQIRNCGYRGADRYERSRRCGHPTGARGGGWDFLRHAAKAIDANVSL